MFESCEKMDIREGVSVFTRGLSHMFVDVVTRGVPNQVLASDSDLLAGQPDSGPDLYSVTVFLYSTMPLACINLFSSVCE